MAPALALALAGAGADSARAEAGAQGAAKPAPARSSPPNAAAGRSPTTIMAPATRRPAAPAARAAPPAPEDVPLPADTAAASADPLEHLRQRLADRLVAPKGATASGSFDVRISTRSGLQGPSGAAAQGVASGRARGGKVAHGPGAGAVHWGYEGEHGPAAWAKLKPEFGLCKTGERQSPIDIRGGLAVNLEPVKFDYQDSPFSVIDNGHTVQVNLQPGNSIDIGGRKFELQQFHFHRPSEERIDGRQFEMSLHLVHKDAQGRLAVVALLFDEGPPHAVVQDVWNNLPLERGEARPARQPLALTELLPDDRRYYTYMGSLTTPPCSEGVQWVVMRSPLSLTAEQIGLFSRIYPMNARPVQSASGRRILQSD
ncbi:hypothetical protein IP80_09300 [beta proteobacterium AAP65]|nr:hypothetical protein IP80_09300 [beta proteobacterium AAP65]